MAGRAAAALRRLAVERIAGTQRRRPARRGQALVEFALVMPLLFAIIFAFIVLSVFTVDSSILTHATVSGARAGNDSMVALNSRLTNTAAANVTMALTPYPFTGLSKSYGPYNAATTAPVSCLKNRNRAAFVVKGSQLFNTNTDVLGWDWGPHTCSQLVIVTEPQLAAPLLAAVNKTDADLRGLLLGAHGTITVKACYANTAGNCMMTVTLTDNGGAAAISGPVYSSVTVTTAAPSFIRVDASVTVISVADIPLIAGFAPPSLALNAHSIEVLDRFLPACPAPLNGMPPPGGCGSIY